MPLAYLAKPVGIQTTSMDKGGGPHGEGRATPTQRPGGVAVTVGKGSRKTGLITLVDAQQKALQGRAAAPNNRGAEM